MNFKDICREEAGVVNEEKEFNTLEEQAAHEEQQFFFTKNAEGKPVIGAIKDDREYYFNSKYDDTNLVNSWCNQVAVSNYWTVLLIFGMGNGEYLRALRKKNKDMLMIVYEPSYSIAKINMDEIGVEDFLEDQKMIILIGKKNLKALYIIWNSIASYEIKEYAKMLVVPNYKNVFLEEWKAVEKIYNECMTRLVFSRNTLLAIGKEITDNSSMNLYDYITQYSLGSLIEQFQEIDLSDIPAIIVSAGPSLDKNIKDLKAAKGKAFIIAVDTALNSLAKEDVIPDITVTVDPHKPISLFENKKMSDVPMIFALSANEKIKEVHTGMRIYQDTTDSVLDRYIKKFHKEKTGLPSGGSVAHDAFSLAQKLDFQTIIFVGQDLAYPNDKEHSEGAYDDAAANDIKNSNKFLFEVEDIYGDKVKTEFNMNQYRLWLEQAVIMYPDIQFIDATEGGAKKKGMEILTLKEAIARECRLEDAIDFSKIIKKTERRFSEEEQNIILQEVSGFSDVLEPVRKKLCNGLKWYEKLKDLNDRKIYQGNEFDKTIKEITEANRWIAEDNDIAYLHLYAATKDYQVRDTILDEKEEIADEIQLVIDSGNTMLNALLEATDKVEKDMEPLIQEAKKRKLQ